jgi:hypothetical protein
MEKDIINKAAITLCKVATNGAAKRSNLVTVELELRRLENGKPEFSACGNVWNATKTDIIRGGQCIDELASPAYMRQYPKDIRAFVKELHELWTLHHLNGLHAGTPGQERLVKEHFEKTGEAHEYGKACAYLKKIKKHIVMRNGQKYQYGSGWVSHDIPQTDMKRIERLFSFVPNPIKGKKEKPKRTAAEIAEFLLENAGLEDFQKEALTQELGFANSLANYINEDTEDYAQAVGEWCNASYSCGDGDMDFGKEHIEEILEYVQDRYGKAELGEFVSKAIEGSFFRYFASAAIDSAVQAIADYGSDEFTEFLET